MTRFFDASAIVAAYARQLNTTRARALPGGRDVAVSRLSEVETVSALACLARERKLSDADRDVAISAFLKDVAGWYVVELTPDVTARARELLLRHPVRASDAVQLASALVIQSRDTGQLRAFVAYDERLASASRREHLTVIDS